MFWIIYMQKNVDLHHIYVQKNVVLVMERIVIKKLIEWKNSSRRKPLVLNGARQVGKTWLLHEFAKLHYAKEAYVYCRKNEMARRIFTQDFDVERILVGLRALTGVDITPNDTLIVLDEVQDIPEAIEALKYFYEQAPQYHIAVAGSLLGLSMHAGVSYPVGKVDEISIYPMNFEEFLLAMGETELLKLLQTNQFDIISAFHEKLIGLLRQYYYVGGMPEAVKEYAATKALNEVRRIQQSILNGYARDFSKHAPKQQVLRIQMVWQSIPSQLFKENKKFFYGALRKGARATDFELALRWLADAGLVYKVPRCTKLASPLSIYEDLSAFKLYALDIGLLGAMAGVDASLIILNSNALSEYKGGMTEQYVLQQMISHGTAPIFYHTADNSRLEVDFVVQQNGLPLPIEVKAGGNVRSNSLTALLANHPEMTALRYSMLPYMQQGQLTNMPLYSVM